MAELVEVNAGNVDLLGFFCLKSQANDPGHLAKRAWLDARFAEGLKMTLLTIDGRSKGFIETIPGPFAWRAVHAPDHLVIHCIWVIGGAKGQGHGGRLLERAEAHARDAGLAGIAALTSRGNWLAGPKLPLRHGYEPVDRAEGFQLLVKRLDAAPDPCLPKDWVARRAGFGPGVTLIRTDQCPYLARSVPTVRRLAAARGLAFRELALTSAAEVQARAPTPYGVYALLRDDRLLTHHLQPEAALARLLGS
jgi:ribosomal protein S18 acetylase RimI-like enzyme